MGRRKIAPVVSGLVRRNIGATASQLPARVPGSLLSTRSFFSSPTLQTQYSGPLPTPQNSPNLIRYKSKKQEQITLSIPTENLPGFTKLHENLNQRIRKAWASSTMLITNLGFLLLNIQEIAISPRSASIVSALIAGLLINTARHFIQAHRLQGYMRNSLIYNTLKSEPANNSETSLLSFNLLSRPDSSVKFTFIRKAVEISAAVNSSESDFNCPSKLNKVKSDIDEIFKVMIPIAAFSPQAFAYYQQKADARQQRYFLNALDDCHSIRDLLNLFVDEKILNDGGLTFLDLWIKDQNISWDMNGTHLLLTKNPSLNLTLEYRP